MPKATTKKPEAIEEKNSLTIGDVFKKVGRIKATTIAYTLLLIAVFIIGYLISRIQYLEKNGQQAQTATQQGPHATLAEVKDAFNKSAIKFGKDDKKLVVLEIADPSCPYCHIAGGKNPELNKQVGPQFLVEADGGTYVPPVPELKKLVDEGKASFAYIYYPGHGNGEMGMKAMYCAQEKGKFWEVSDLLMNSQGYDLLNNTVKNDPAQSQVLTDYLAGAIDPTFMKTCLDSGKYDARLKEDIQRSTNLGMTATPGFYLNETPYQGAYSFTDMQPTVKSAGI